MRSELLLATAVVFAVSTVMAADAERTVTKAGEVLNEVMNTPVAKIPEALLADAEAIAIFPGVVKVGFVAGVERGRGVVVIKGEDRNWQAPRFVTITGGSVGWQVGASATDLILVFKTRKGVDNLLTGKFKIGADIAAAAGPVGRRAEAATDGQLQAEIYSYSRSRGLFAGASIDGALIQLDVESEREYYQVDLNGKLQSPESVGKLVAIIATYSKSAEADAANPVGEKQFAGVNQDDRQRTQAVAASGQLSRVLDETWQRHLALPAEAYAEGGRPSAANLALTLSRFDQVARDPQYARVASRVEFQQAYAAIAEYANALAGQQSNGVISLPPPPMDR